MSGSFLTCASSFTAAPANRSIMYEAGPSSAIIEQSLPDCVQVKSMRSPHTSDMIKPMFIQASGGHAYPALTYDPVK